MRLYETMLLIDARLDTPQAEGVVARFGELVAEHGGEMKNVDNWGRRRLAYEIDDLQEGYYSVTTYTLDPGQRSALEATLPFVEGLMRTKTVYPEPRTRRSRRKPTGGPAR